VVGGVRAGRRLLGTIVRAWWTGRQPNPEVAMARCEVCGNDYDKAFELVMQGERHTFESFECAIHAVAPTCRHCGRKIIGHGVEADGRVFCCANCSHLAGVAALSDRA
jgi:hypothetical protein